MADIVLTLDSISLTTNDVLIINTETWTVTKNGTNYVSKADSASEFFDLVSGTNSIEFTGTGAIDVSITYKNRWA